MRARTVGLPCPPTHRRKVWTVIRPLLNGAVRFLVFARIQMEELQHTILTEMREGFRPTYRGHEWSHQQFADLELAGHAIELAFSALKMCQFPEVRHTRVDEVERALDQLEGCYYQTDQGYYGPAQLPPGDERGQSLSDAV